MRLSALLLLLLCACGNERSGPDVGDRVRAARETVRRRAADCRPLLDLASARVEDFFAPCFERVGGFTEDLFGFRGKWRAAFWGREDYDRWVRRAFERRVFRPEDFEREVLIPICRDFTHACAAAGNRVAVEAHGLIRSEVPSLSLEAFAAECRRPAEEVAPAVRADAAVNFLAMAAGEAATLTVGSLFAAAGVCAASSWWNFGIGLIVGVVAAIAVEETAGEAWEEAARMRVHAELVRLRREVADRVLRAVAQAWMVWMERLELATAAAVERSLS